MSFNSDVIVAEVITREAIERLDKKRFQPFPKIQRYTKQTVTITEKIDGTNAALNFTDDGELTCQSRNRIIVPGNDNAAFAAWAHEHREPLFEFFGPGLHFGEWWGLGIQRGYGQSRRWFSPFNTHRWNGFAVPLSEWPDGTRPTPVLGIVQLEALDGELDRISHLHGRRSMLADHTEAEGWMLHIGPQGLYLKMPFDPLPKGGKSNPHDVPPEAA